MNRLYYGDNLDVLRGCIDNESVDLIYLDPPFKQPSHLQRALQEHGRGKIPSANRSVRGHLALGR